LYKFLGVKKELYVSIALLMGTIVGAGILSIPYVAAKAGLLTALVDIVLIGLAVLMIHLMIADISGVHSSKKFNLKHQLTGYVENYLGKKGKTIMAIAMIIGIFGALTAYIIGEGNVLHTIFPSISSQMFSIMFFIIASTIVLLGLRATGNIDVMIVSFVILSIILIGIFSLGKNVDASVVKFSLKDIFIPYGAILFASTGFVAIPEILMTLAKKNKIDKNLLKKAIIIGTLIPIILSLIFTIVVTLLVGKNFLILPQEQQIATVAAGLFIDPFFKILINTFAALAMFTAFLALGLALVQILNFDYGIKRTVAWTIAMFPPLLVFLFGWKNFIQTVIFTGVFSAGLEGILISLAHIKAASLVKRNNIRDFFVKNKIVPYAIILLFVLGILLEIY